MSFIDIAIFIILLIVTLVGARPIGIWAFEHQLETDLPRMLYVIGAGLLGWGLAVMTHQLLGWFATPLALLMAGGVYGFVFLTHLPNRSK